MRIFFLIPPNLVSQEFQKQTSWNMAAGGQRGRKYLSKFPSLSSCLLPWHQAARRPGGGWPLAPDHRGIID